MGDHLTGVGGIGAIVVPTFDVSHTALGMGHRYRGCDCCEENDYVFHGGFPFIKFVHLPLAKIDAKLFATRDFFEKIFP
jgi:hypothetical protein